jgi:nicotinate-nucleotide adenylyltransferase
MLVPVGEAPHRRIDPEPGPGVRLELTRAATAGEELLEASDVETAREGPSFTYRTLELLRESDGDGELWLLMGADVAAHLDEWREPERVIELARLGVAARPGTALDEAEGTLERLGAMERAETIGMPEIGVSSTWIRRRVAAGGPIHHLVPDDVVELIDAEGLYRP